MHPATVEELLMTSADKLDDVDDLLLSSADEVEEEEEEEEKDEEEDEEVQEIMVIGDQQDCALCLEEIKKELPAKTDQQSVSNDFYVTVNAILNGC